MKRIPFAIIIVILAIAVFYVLPLRLEKGQEVTNETHAPVYIGIDLEGIANLDDGIREELEKLADAFSHLEDFRVDTSLGSFDSSPSGVTD
ncbi:hypothetical protein MYX06_02425 [Patescibacteria group bacterium AH-259-L05]|nr:hypothetical protein [Patescibacteria group bacterium AH-259-L05]